MIEHWLSMNADGGCSMSVARLEAVKPAVRVVADEPAQEVESPKQTSSFWIRRTKTRQDNALSRLERDHARGYSINVKQVVLAFAVEFWIIGLIIVGTYLLIAESASDHVSREQVFSALLLPAALAMVELARVPLAIAVRTQDAWHIKFFAALGVVAAITVTSFSLSQIAWKTFDIRIAEATRAGDRLTEARNKKDIFDDKIAESGREIDQKIKARNSVAERVAGLESQVTKVSSFTGLSCKPVPGPDGKPLVDIITGKVQQSCSPTAVVNQAQLNTLKGQIGSTKKELEVAELALKQSQDDAKSNDRGLVERELASAEVNYRAAVNKSQLHSYTSMVTGKAVSEVTEAEVKSLEKYLIIIPSIAAAFASTLIAITAVRRLKPITPEPTATISDEAAAYLFGPLITAIQTEAKEAVATAVGGRAKVTATAAALG